MSPQEIVALLQLLARQQAQIAALEAECERLREACAAAMKDGGSGAPS